MFFLCVIKAPAQRVEFSLMCSSSLSTGSADRHQRAGGDGRSVLCGPAEAEEADGPLQPSAPAGPGERHHGDADQSGQVSKEMLHSQEIHKLNMRGCNLPYLYHSMFPCSAATHRCGCHSGFPLKRYSRNKWRPGCCEHHWKSVDVIIMKTPEREGETGINNCQLSSFLQEGVKQPQDCLLFFFSDKRSRVCK